ncbi:MULTISPECIES: enoyl-CoA hydratase/isomerase family protein [Streptomyces]|uniref:Enoyl-CoA hydratase/isomerase family protein n=2 Tax=Streptomyces TaxID=1883 RepID=A0A4Q9HZ54_STRKA|nr:enoyl-CoA hydratase/isomerase family protein [Streptomyces kasugaensis]TBO60562.1 enoyl-CoA hydratase/isomerase family protein [Streptomyces kasugaensis]WSK16523.1 enoyl-CoA hydratase/isomerase family protein [Streptomyces celluloflavus]
MEPGLRTCVSDGTATVTISNTGKRNAMTAGMWRELPPLLARLAADRAVRALVLTGEGGTFCAGADIGALRDAVDEPQALAVAAEEALAAFPGPTLAAIRGYCVGGGCQLAAACDLRFAEEGALFGVTPAKLAVVYPVSATRRLVRLVGPSAAKYLLFSGELIDSARALRTGLVDEVLPEGELDKRVADFAAVLASRSRLTQTAAKELVDGAWDVPVAAAEERAAYWAAQARESGDTVEGAAAFLERRAPRFTWPAG